ncbi:hypothetical protein [Lysobacter xanthus]
MPPLITGSCPRPEPPRPCASARIDRRPSIDRDFAWKVQAFHAFSRRHPDRSSAHRTCAVARHLAFTSQGATVATVQQAVAAFPFRFSRPRANFPT